jgi:hypothetical protein
MRMGDASLPFRKRETYIEGELKIAGVPDCREPARFQR